ncbi:Tetratricopeptide repeat protein 21B [Amphibalanus amphitrite]|uniref:Tetratricopeptide repeat protein 21B n=1 Tax=Amphibalanus amphitrite TaxID=1232801 RepID=A0A6A4VYM3_AMPAM|nr:Tetratricopeptide repeat protein 21B [Amphibalanus amphitrite]
MRSILQGKNQLLKEVLTEMMDEGKNKWIKAQCQYYCRERYYRAMQLTASEAMKKFGQGPAFRFWFSLSLAMEGKLQEAIREFENTLNDSDLQLATILAMMYCHQLCQSVDRQAVQQLDNRRREERKRAGDRALYYAGMFLVLTGHPDKAREYLDRTLKMNADAVDAWVMRGWVEMYAGENPTKAIDYLDQAEKRNNRDISLLFCKARYYELHNDFTNAQSELNQVVAMRPGFVPPLVEKMKVSMAMLDWDQSVDMMNSDAAMSRIKQMLDGSIATVIAAFETKFNSMQQRIDVLEGEVMDRDVEIRSLHEQLVRQGKALEEQQERTEGIDLNRRLSTLILTCDDFISKTTDEDVEQKISQVLNQRFPWLNMTPKDIQSAHRLQANNKVIPERSLDLQREPWWELTSDRVLATSPHCIEALRFRLIGLLTRDGNYPEASKRLEEFVRNVDRHEPHNPPFLLECARLFSRTCGRNDGVLDFTLAMAEKAAQLEPGRAEYLVEVAYQNLLKEKTREALKFYKAATKQDEASMEALSGIITCQLIDGDHQVAQQSLEFLKETQKSLGYTADILYLSALLARKQNKSPEEVLGLLNEAIETHFRSFRTLSLGVQYLIALNPDFLLLVVKDCLHYAPTQG